MNAMLCRRCKQLFWELKATRKGDTREITYHRSARSPSFESRQRCSACMLFYGSNRYHGRIKTEIIWTKRSRTEYALVFNIHDSKDIGSRLSENYFQVTRIGPRHGTGTCNATIQFCLKISDSLADRLRFGINEQTIYT